MNENAVLSAYLNGNLADSLEEGLALNVSRSSADFCDDDVSVCSLSYRIYKTLDLVCNVRDYLNGAAQIISGSFLVKDVPVNLSRSKV